MNTIKKLVMALVLAVPCLLAAPAVPAENLSISVETELEAAGPRRQTREYLGGLLCLPERCTRKLCCQLEPF